MKQARGKSILPACVFAALLAACSEEPARGPETAAVKPAAAHASAAPGTELQFTPPAGWIVETPGSSMRKAQYRLPRAAGDPEDAELAVFYFQGGGGTVQANIDRWIGQFTKADGSPANDTAKTARRESHGIPLTVVDVSGTYLSAMGPMLSETQPKPGYRMLAAVAEADSGPWFFKLTGPEGTVGRWEASFQEFLDTIQ